MKDATLWGARLRRQLLRLPCRVLWLALHLVYLAGLRYRTIVLINWICNYLFRSQHIRMSASPSS